MTAPLVADGRGRLSGATASAAIGGLFLVFLVSLALGVGAGGTLTMLFPVVAGAVAFYLYAHRPLGYICLVFWVWLLIPELRRLVDQQAGWSPSNPIMLTPYVITLISALTLLRRPRMLKNRTVFPIACCLGGVAVGFAIGVARVGPSPAVYGLLEWVTPFVFAFYLALLPVPWERLVRCVWRLALWGTLLIGTYGLIQFFWLPSWDAFWMKNAPITSIGQPEPLKVRVFSTLNSPGPFAFVLVVLLLLLAMRSGRLKGLAITVGALALALSLVRAGWLAIALGGLVLLASRRTGSARGSVRTLLIAVPLVIVFTQAGPISGVISSRASSIGSVSQDVSFNDRLRLYQSFSGTAISNPLGNGIGSTGAATKLSNTDNQLGTFGDFDSGILELPFVLGWVGAFLFIYGLVRLLVDGFKVALTDRRAQSALNAVAVAGLSGMVFVNVLKGVSGVLIAMGFALAVRARLDKGLRPSVALSMQGAAATE